MVSTLYNPFFNPLLYILHTITEEYETQRSPPNYHCCYQSLDSQRGEPRGGGSRERRGGMGAPGGCGLLRPGACSWASPGAGVLGREGSSLPLLRPAKQSTVTVTELRYTLCIYTTHTIIYSWDIHSVYIHTTHRQSHIAGIYPMSGNDGEI